MTVIFRLGLALDLLPDQQQHPDSYLTAEKKLELHVYGSPFNFCGLVVGLVGFGFSPTVKLVAEKSFNVNKLLQKFVKLKSQLVMHYWSLNEYDSNELNFVYSIGLINMCKHCLNSDTNIVSHYAILK